MKIYAILVMLVCVACLGACRKQDIRTTVIKVPALTSPETATLIQAAFSTQPGIVSLRPDIEKHEVQVTYNSMVIAIKNLEYTIADAGYDANDIPSKTNRVAVGPVELK